ncbi:MAG: hypothetical protein JRH11_20155 [Deltaproteobacteria bacterium]|nr:hypothetical protein [Deltaproteobacteria bacterium]
MLRIAPSVLLFVILSAGLGCDGCSDSPDPTGDSCTSSADCTGDQTCVDSVCVGRDGGPAVDTGLPPITGDCIDEDGDRLGVGADCDGPDCDDTNPNRGGAEVCDMVDNDCDDVVDEGFELCAGCTLGCEVDGHPGSGGFMPDDMNSDGVIVDDDGALTLGREVSESFAVWVANTNEGTVSRLDSRTNVETARYPTVGSMAPAGTRPAAEACSTTANTGNCPSRTAVDQNFDAYVANRAFGHQGSVTKYANSEDDCVDRDASGTIETSRDLNGDGVIELDPTMGEYIGVTDECILWTAAVGTDNDKPRALAIGLAPPDSFVGNVWVGLFSGDEACELDATDGRTIGCVALAGFQPYGAVTDALGRIWFADRSGGRRDIIGYVDPGAMTFTPAAPVPAGIGCDTANLTSYGITTDADGTLYVASSNCAPGLLRFDPVTDEWTSYDLPGGGTPRGIAADETSLWIGISHNTIRFVGGYANRVLQYNLADMAFVATHTIPTGTGPVGVGVSFDGSIWAVCQGTNSAARLDPIAGTWTEHGVGLTPYTYSDFIGFGLNTFAQPRGYYRFVTEGCESGLNRWFGASYEGEVPPMTSVEFYARVAETLPDLAAATFVGPFTTNPADFTVAPGPVPTGRYIEVEVRMRTEDRLVAPRIFNLNVAGVCEPILE